MSSYFFSEIQENSSNSKLIKRIEKYAEESKEMIYVIDRPLGDSKYTYNYKDAIIFLSPRKKIAVIDYGKNAGRFEDYVEDIIEDLGSISDKFLYKDTIGRPRTW